MAISDFLDLMPHTVQHAAFSGRTAYGKPSYGSQTAYRARWVKKLTKVKDFGGNEVMARHVVWIAGTPDIGAEDQITLPDGTTPVLLSVEEFPDESGGHHVKVFMG